MKPAKIPLVIFLVLLIVLNIPLVNSQTIDDSFKDPLPIRPAKIQCIKVLADDKILLGGDIAFFKTQRVNNLIRLNSDSTIDETFSFKGDKLLLIKEIELQSSGDILVLAQGYESLSGVRNDNHSLFLLDQAGAIKKQIDTLLSPESITVQSDDKVLVGGGINTRGYVYRLNKDLSPDPTFNNNISFDKMVTDIVVDGTNLFACGDFSLVNGTLKNDIVKLNLDGTIDTSFDTGAGTTDYIGSITLQADGKILVGEAYINSFNGVQCHGMVRLNQNGSVDSGFTPPFLSGGSSEIKIKDSGIYLSAPINLYSFYGSYLLKLNNDGSMVTGFKPVQLEEFGFFDFCLGFKGNDIIFSNSSSKDNIYGLSKCDSAGNRINTFTPEVSRYGIITIGDYFNNKLIVAGDFIKINGIETHGVAKLNNDGSVDESFIFNDVLATGLQIKILDENSMLLSLGKIFIKLNDKAQILPDFNFTQFKTLYQVLKFEVTDSGKIYAGDGNNVYRLNVTGTEDPTFNIGSGLCCTVCTSFDFDLQNNKIIFGSEFNQFNGIPVNRLVRLNPDGSVDQSFDIGTGPDGTISMIKVLNSGEIIVGGSFKYFDGIEIPHGIVKLSENGEVNLSFIENQKTTQFCGVELLFVKVEQSDSLLFIKGTTKISVLNINGKFDCNFNLPFEVGHINDIIALKDSSKYSPGKKGGSGYINMYAIGTFNKYGVTDPSFIFKLAVDGLGPSSIEDGETTDAGFRVYPIPVNDKMRIETPTLLDQAMITIYSMNGIELFSSKISEGKIEIDMNKYPTGFYLVRISTKEGTIITKKIIKQ